MTWSAVVGGVEASVQVGASIAAVRLCGEITPTSLVQIKDAVLAVLAECGPVVGFLVHFENARIRCTAAELTAIFDGGGVADQAAMPAAMVVTEQQMPVFRSHVWECAWRGIVRQAFTDVGDATAWLTARAEVAAQTRASLTPVI